MSIIGTCPRSFCRMLIHLWPCCGIGAAIPGHSLPTYSSMAASVHRLAVRALGHVDDHVPFFHRFAILSRSSSRGTSNHRCGTRSLRGLRRIARSIHFAGTSGPRNVRLISLSFSIAAKVSDMCSVRRSHSSTCTSELRAGERVGRSWSATCAASAG